MMALGLVKQNEEGIYYDVFRNRITFPIKKPKWCNCWIFQQEH